MPEWSCVRFCHRARRQRELEVRTATSFRSKSETGFLMNVFYAYARTHQCDLVYIYYPLKLIINKSRY